jgi:hypothetical protein
MSDITAAAAFGARCLRARTDLCEFIELVIKDERGDPIVLDWIHRMWIFHVDYAWSHGKHALILAPFGSGKTSGLAVPICAWLLGRDPQERIKFVSNGDDFAKQRVSSVKAILESREYRAVFPGTRRSRTGRWTDHELEVERAGNAVDPSVHARGVLTKGIGGRADRLIFDDICDQLNTEEPGARAKVKMIARGTWMSRLDGTNARALMIATPWHTDDATHDFWEAPTWCTLKQSVSQDLEVYEQEVFGSGPDYTTLLREFAPKIYEGYDERRRAARQHLGVV